MLTTNLLPQVEKKNVAREAVRRIALFFTVAFSFVFVVGTVLLFPTYVNFYLEERELKKALAVEEEAARLLKIQEKMRRVDTVRTIIDSVRLNVSTPQKASLLLGDLLRRREGITLRSLSVKKDGGVSFNGVAATRNSLLEFEKMLRESGDFHELTSPDYTKKTDISFTMQGKLKPARGL